MDGCGRNQKGLGYCMSHYRQFKSGEPFREIKPKLRDFCSAAESLEQYTPTGLCSNECWPWKGGISKNGYGTMHADGVVCFAHRSAWEVANGRKLLPGEVIMHSCDNRPCVNPGHLSAATQHANLTDMSKKGRSTHGERSYNARLTEVEVRAIRNRFAAGIRNKDIAREFAITPGQVTSIVKRTIWRHVT